MLFLIGDNDIVVANQLNSHSKVTAQTAALLLAQCKYLSQGHFNNAVAVVVSGIEAATS